MDEDDDLDIADRPTEKMLTTDELPIVDDAAEPPLEH